MKKYIKIIATLLFSTMFYFTKAQSNITDKGVEINGVIWATRNVDAPNTFANNPEDGGMFYQWNRNIGWSTTDPLVSTDRSLWDKNWDGNWKITDTWETNVCPIGWRVPTKDEFLSLLETSMVNEELQTESGQIGRKFTDKTNGNSVFFPIIGFRCWDTHHLLSVGENCNYWTSTTFLQEFTNLGICIQIYNVTMHKNQKASMSNPGPAPGDNVRCVKDKDIPWIVTFFAGNFTFKQHIEHGKLAFLPGNPMREGYTFGGWFAEESCEHEWNFETNTVTAHTTLYAKWILNDPVGIGEATKTLVPVAYYNLLGQKLNEEPQKGMYFILYDNGSTEKRAR
ncbi:MAG: InlB B-repeat-containing protein [Bacteroidales bacterium]|jgi:uncharacterized protein (TIGR02145 family)/uncharacterized repeat protein (TIGR02543 family)|nr:InlB B-repeat-containing protein [Bacteroidales bacterium]